MPEVEAAGRVPEPFPADNKEEIHGTTANGPREEEDGVMDMKRRYFVTQILLNIF
jgi:hypothetical protein